MKRDYRTFFKKTGMALLAFLLFGLCSGLLYVTKLASVVQKVPDGKIEETANTNVAEEVREQMDGYWTVAVFGVDSRNGSLGAGANADAQILCTINRDSGEMKLVSVYRDTLLMVQPESGQGGKINSAYMMGGPALLVKALNENLDLKIDDYVSFSWKAAIDAINMLGGVDIEIEDKEFYYINSFITETVEMSGVPSNHLESTGMQHLDGVQAVAYCRLRLMDTDFQRSERQRKVIGQLLDKAKKEDPGTLNRILMEILPQTATSIGLDDMTDVLLDAGKYHIAETAGFPFEYETAKLGKTGECVVANTLESNVARLHQILYGDEAYHVSKRVLEIEQELIKQAVGR